MSSSEESSPGAEGVALVVKCTEAMVAILETGAVLRRLSIGMSNIW